MHIDDLRHTSTRFSGGLLSYSCIVSEPYTRYSWSSNRHKCVGLWACSSIVHSSVSMQLVYFPVTTKPTACCVTLTNVHHCSARIYHSLKTCSSFRREWRQKMELFPSVSSVSVAIYEIIIFLQFSEMQKSTFGGGDSNTHRTLKVIHDIFHGR